MYSVSTNSLWEDGLEHKLSRVWQLAVRAAHVQDTALEVGDARVAATSVEYIKGGPRIPWLVDGITGITVTASIIIWLIISGTNSKSLLR